MSKVVAGLGIMGLLWFVCFMFSKMGPICFGTFDYIVNFRQRYSKVNSDPEAIADYWADEINNTYQIEGYRERFPEVKAG